METRYEAIVMVRNLIENFFPLVRVSRIELLTKTYVYSINERLQKMENIISQVCAQKIDKKEWRFTFKV